jgi:hypothetical protein
MECKTCHKEFVAKSSNKLGLCPPCNRDSFRYQEKTCIQCKQIFTCSKKHKSNLCKTCNRMTTECIRCKCSIQISQTKNKSGMCKKCLLTLYNQKRPEKGRQQSRTHYATNRQKILQARKSNVLCQGCNTSIEVTANNVLRLCASCKSQELTCHKCNKQFQSTYKNQTSICPKCRIYGVKAKECTRCKATFYCNRKNSLSLCNGCKVLPTNCSFCQQSYIRKGHFTYNICQRCCAAKNQIAEFYKNCPKGWHVDHIIPLQGDTVSGLHILENLQYLPGSINDKKSNKLIREYLEAPLCLLNLEEYL